MYGKNLFKSVHVQADTGDLLLKFGFVNITSSDDLFSNSRRQFTFELKLDYVTEPLSTSEKELEHLTGSAV